MTMMIKLDPPIEINTPQGKGYARYLIENMWIGFYANDEVFCFRNSQIKMSLKDKKEAKYENMSEDFGNPITG